MSERSSEGDAIDPARRRRSRLLLVAIFAAFIVPLLAAGAWLRVVESGRGGDLGDTSRGELIVPAATFEPFALERVAGDGAATIDADTLRGRWTLLYLPEGECAEVCRRNLYHMRQVRLALNHRMTRVQRMVVLESADQLDPALLAEHEGLVVAGGEEAARESFAAQIARAEADMARSEDAIYLVDPRGNLMMRFAANLPPKAMLEDVKHLLKVSRIG